MSKLSIPENQTPLLIPENQTPLLIPENQTPLLIPENQTPLLIPENQTPLLIPENQTPLLIPENQTSLLIPENQTSLLIPENQTSLLIPENQTSLLIPENQTSLLIPENQTPVRYFKIINKNANHNGFQYVDGLNVLIEEPFAEKGHCISGGFYFTDATHILEFLNYGCFLCEITLPIADNDFKMVKDGNNKWRSNKIILGHKHDLANVATFKYLIEAGTDISSGNISVIQWAGRNNYIEIVKYLVSLK